MGLQALSRQSPYAYMRILRSAMDVDRFRAILRACREAVGETQKTLAVKTGATGTRPVNSMTISEIETGAIIDPGIVTVSRLVEAMGLTLSAFFAQIETGHASSTHVQPVPLLTGQVAGADTVPQTAAALQALAVANADIAETLKEIAKGVGITRQPRRQTTRTRTKKPTPSKVRRKTG